jgi:hypothetical protein
VRGEQLATFATRSERAMWDEIQNLRRLDLEVREQLNVPERDWVIGRLVARSGVNGALWRGAQPGAARSHGGCLSRPSE